MTYTSLEQRMTSAYLTMLPEFIPKKDAPVSIAEQQIFYDLIKKLYQLLYDDPVAFAYCLFDETYVYSIDVYARLFSEKPFRRLEKWMLSQGYKPYDRYKTDWIDYQLTLAYANPAWNDELPNIGNEYKIKHTGISAQYDAYVRDPAALGLCIPISYEKVEYQLCPYFPGYQYSWTSIDDELVDNMIEFLSFMDSVLDAKSCAKYGGIYEK